MKRNIRFWLFLLLGVMVTVFICMFFYRSNGEIDATYGPLGDAIENKKAFDKQYSNLVFDDGCYNQDNYAKINSLYSFTCSANMEVEQSQKEYLHSLICEIALNVMGVDISAVPYDIEFGMVTGRNDDYQFQINDINTFSIEINDRYRMPVAYSGKRTNLFRIDERVDISDYKVFNGEGCLEELVDLCDELNSKYMKDLMIGNGLRLKTIYEFDTNDNDTEYILRYEHTYNEIGFNDSGNFANIESGIIRPNWLEYIFDCNGISCVRGFYGVKIEKVDELRSDFLTLESACNILSDYLAPYGEYVVENISIKYCSLDFYDGVNHTELEYKPMWAFLVQADEINDYDLDPRMVMYVDMQDASVYVIDSITNEIWFNLNPKGKKE